MANRTTCGTFREMPILILQGMFITKRHLMERTQKSSGSPLVRLIGMATVSPSWLLDWNRWWQTTKEFCRSVKTRPLPASAIFQRVNARCASFLAIFVVKNCAAPATCASTKDCTTAKSPSSAPRAMRHSDGPYSWRNMNAVTTPSHHQSTSRRNIPPMMTSIRSFNADAARQSSPTSCLTPGINFLLTQSGPTSRQNLLLTFAVSLHWETISFYINGALRTSGFRMQQRQKKRHEPHIFRLRLFPFKSCACPLPDLFP